MRIGLRLERNRIRRWHVVLVERLRRQGHAVAIDFAEDRPAPDGLERLLGLERRLLRQGKPLGCDLLSLVALPGPALTDLKADVLIDLTHAPAARCWYVRYDGITGEDAAFEAILTGADPVFEIVDNADGSVLERGHASIEVAVGTGGRLDAIAARITTLLLARLNAHAKGKSRPVPTPIAPVRRGARRSPFGILARELLSSMLHQAYRLLCYSPHWRVGWRYIDGPGVLETGSLSGPAWKVMPDPGDMFYADPFPVSWQGREAIFVEAMDHRTGKGEIAVIMMGPDGPVGPAQTVLSEPWHLSYPHILEHEGSLYMIPESSRASEVALYRCTDFPLKWDRVSTLITDAVISDATVFQHEGRWWMTAVSEDGAGGHSDTLVLYHSETLEGEWKPHPLNPILVDRASARPAGNVVMRDGRLWRPVQDCSGGYGMSLSIAEITRLDLDGFEQRIHSSLGPNRIWPGRKLHSLNRAGRLEVIDGSVIRPRLKLGTMIAERLTRPAIPSS